MKFASDKNFGMFGSGKRMLVGYIAIGSEGVSFDVILATVHRHLSVA
jgi:hypothetical protein